MQTYLYNTPMRGKSQYFGKASAKFHLRYAEVAKSPANRLTEIRLVCYNKYMISVADYDAGNIHSVLNALDFLGKEARLSSDPHEIERADFVLLPGVGAFGAAMRSLKEKGLDTALKNRMAADRPTLGICLGLQLLFDGSEESEGERGLGFLKGKVKRLPVTTKKLPHIGWTTLENCRGSFKDFENRYMYFVHGYAAVCENESDVAAYADYDGKFTAAVERGNVRACQFHPEKSSADGLRLLEKLLGEEGR